MALEIERKFLVTATSGMRRLNQSALYRVIFQRCLTVLSGYVSGVKGAYITIKGRTDRRVLPRYEWEKEIPLKRLRNFFCYVNPA